jgi:hypothetical protein
MGARVLATVIETRRLLLRPLELADVPYIQNLFP